MLAGTVCVFFAFLSGSAEALVTHPYLFSFPSGASTTENFGGVAIDQATGDVYVGDTQARELRKYNEAGVPTNFSALGTNVITGLSAPAIAVDPTDGDIYVAPTVGGQTVERFAPSGEPADFTAGSNAGTNVLTGAETPQGSFGSVAGLAVDSTGDIYVSQNAGPAAIAKFLPSGAYAGQEIADPSINFLKWVAVDSAGSIYDVDPGEANVVKFDAGGTLLSTIDTGGRAKAGIAVDPATNALFVGYETGFAQFSSGGQPEGEFGGGEVKRARAIAVNSSSVPDPADGDVYVQDDQRKEVDVFGPLVLVPDVSSGSAASALKDVTVTGTVNTAGIEPEDALTGCRFEYVTQAAFEADSVTGDGFSDLSSGGSVPCETSDGTPISNPGEIPDDEQDHVVSAAIAGLPSNSDYRFRLVAENSNGPSDGAGVPFRTAGPPAIEALYTTDVSATAATLGAEVNPDFLNSSYYFQYVDDVTYHADVEAAGPEHGFDHATSIPGSPVDIGSGHSAQVVSQLITDLSPATAYHYRVIATNAAGTTVSLLEATFRTRLTALGFTLPDSRAWEQVSPVAKGSQGQVVAPFAGTVESSEDGNAFTYVTLGPISEAESSRALEPQQSLSRHGQGGWTSEEIDPAQETVAPYSANAEFRVFSPDLSVAAVEPFGLRAAAPSLLSDESSERTPYLRENLADPVRWQPLVTGKEPFANVAPGTRFGGEPESQLLPLGWRFPVAIVGASSDLGHIVLESKPSLTADAGGVGHALYEWTRATGTLRLVSRLPASEGGTPSQAFLGFVNSSSGIQRDAISADGRYVFWSTESENPKALYLRDTVTNETVRLDVPLAGASGGNPRPRFQGASADGRRAFFTDTQHLTSDASETGADLYECEVVTTAGEDSCVLRDLTPETNGQAADVLGVVSAISQSGDDAYFVANGALAGGASGGNCSEPPPPGATCNLYRAHFDGSVWSTEFIATLSNGDAPDWGLSSSLDEATAEQPLENFLAAGSSPSGRYFTFVSRRSLTGYDNHDAASGEADEEVYLFDAAAPEGEDLVCVSCDPSGARPTGLHEARNALRAPSDWHGLWSQRWIAAIPADSGWSGVEGPSPIYQPRRVLDNGRVYFTAFDSLVPADSNGTSDAYQYEPHGVGDCTSSSSGVATVQGQGGRGCISILSSGTSNLESSVLDASATGNDVFILTNSKLSVLDEDPDYDIYDARVDGVPARREPAAECQGEACQATASSPNDPTPASAAFAGPGNVKEVATARCPKGKKRVKSKGKTRCVKKRRPRKHAARHDHHQKAGHKRRVIR